MNQYLRNMSATQQVGLLFLILFGLLTAASLARFAASFRERETAQGQTWHEELRRLSGLLKTSWFVSIIFWIGWVLGETVATVLFGILAFFALREFITLSPTRRGDHRSLILAFFVVLPAQFWFVVKGVCVFGDTCGECTSG
jgi:phosphatidate cytidylyltransferase